MPEYSLCGYAAVFDSLSQNLGGFRETIQRQAFDRTLRSGVDVSALYHHQSGDIVGRLSNNTLQLHTDAHGLRFSLTLPDTNVGRDLYALVERGDVSQMSFGFRIPDTDGESWFERDGQVIRELLDIDLIEISSTPFPAYTATSVAVRGAPQLAAPTTAEGANRGTRLRMRHGLRVRGYAA